MGGFQSDILFSYMLEKYIVCDICGARSPSFESRSVLYITPTYLYIFHAGINNARIATKIIKSIFTGDPLHSRAACTQPCNVNTHSRAHCSPGARLCEQWGHGCVNNGARLCASARLCRGSPVIFQCKKITLAMLNLAKLCSLQSTR